MNIVFLSTSDSGGAGKAAYSIYLNLKKAHECKFVVFRKDTLNSDVIEINKVKKASFFSHWLINKFLNKLTLPRFVIKKEYDMLNLMETAPYLNLNELYTVLGNKPDLIILNWISGFINSRDIKDIYNRYQVPLIWFLHDYAPLTGGCHIAWDCIGYTKSCGHCPGLNSSVGNDFTNQIHRNKAKNLADIPVYTTGWSEFILSKSRESSLFKDHTFTPIIPVIDSAIFFPSEDKNQSKELFHIAKECKVILFGAQNVFSEYKGFKQLLSALIILNKFLNPAVSFCLVTFGKSDEELNTNINFPWVKLGKLDNPGLAYQTADVFVAPTLQDTGPMTVCESLMCGVPVVGYPMGIIPSIIVEGETGSVVERGNIIVLAQKIAEILNLSDEEYSIISEKCRNKAVSAFTEAAQLNSFETLFDFVKPKNREVVNI